jgi:hypothetical protein
MLADLSLRSNWTEIKDELNSILIFHVSLHWALPVSFYKLYTKQSEFETKFSFSLNRRQSRWSWSILLVKYSAGALGRSLKFTERESKVSMWYTKLIIFSTTQLCRLVLFVSLLDKRYTAKDAKLWLPM